MNSNICFHLYWYELSDIFQLIFFSCFRQLEREEMLTRGNCVRLEHTLRMQFEKELNERWSL